MVAVNWKKNVRVLAWQGARTDLFIDPKIPVSPGMKTSKLNDPILVIIHL